MTRSQDIVLEKLISIANDDEATNKLFNDIAVMLAKFDTEKIHIDHNTKSGFYTARVYFRGIYKHLKMSKDKEVIDDAVNRYLKL